MKKFGLIGRSLGHSFSKDFFSDYFLSKGIDAVYENVELNDLADVRTLFEHYNGLNVTIPFKESILPFLDELDPQAASIGAVNTIRIKDGISKGYNTDALGFHRSIKPFLASVHERAIVFGTGGASKAVLHVLESLGINTIVISRNPEPDQFAYDEVNEIMVSNCKLLINTTPVGMYPDSDKVIDLPYEAISKDHLVVDLIYNPEKTLFLEKAELQGAQILNGLPMLKEQALASYRIWNE